MNNTNPKLSPLYCEIERLNQMLKGRLLNDNDVSQANYWTAADIQDQFNCIADALKRLRTDVSLQNMNKVPEWNGISNQIDRPFLSNSLTN